MQNSIIKWGGGEGEERRSRRVKRGEGRGRKKNSRKKNTGVSTS